MNTSFGVAGVLPSVTPLRSQTAEGMKRGIRCREVRVAAIKSKEKGFSRYRFER